MLSGAEASKTPDGKLPTPRRSIRFFAERTGELSKSASTRHLRVKPNPGYTAYQLHRWNYAAEPWHQHQHQQHWQRPRKSLYNKQYRQSLLRQLSDVNDDALRPRTRAVR